MPSMPDSELCYLSATEARSLFRERKLSPVELLQAQLGRIEQLEPTINALSATRVEQALAQARAAEKVFSGAPDTARPLEGIPTILKNEHSLVGMSVTQGSWLCGDTPEQENAPIVQSLLDAGAVIHGQSNVPEFYLAGFTRSLRHGVTRNPWNTAVTCGGSSGGSGAALAAGMTTLATGSDIGGSIRIPASYCGLVGLKPSYGRVPEAVFSYATNICNHNGPMARTVADCALMFNVINGPHSADPTTVKPKLLLPEQYAPIKGMKIAVSYNLGYFEVHEDVLRNTRDMVAVLRELGAQVDEIDLGWNVGVSDTFSHYLGFLLGGPLAEAVRGQGDKITDYIADFTALAAGFTPQKFLATTPAIAAMHESMRGVLERYDAMICPTMADIDTPAEGVPDSWSYVRKQAMTYPFNLLSRHPVLSVPSGLARNGVPTGVQIVGPTFDEATVMRIGAALEQELHWGRPAL